MNEIVKIDENTMTVSARDLHDALEVKTAFKDWYPRMCEYGFTEGTDFSSKMSESTGGRPAMDAAISIDMAKEICMIQHSTEPSQRAMEQGLFERIERTVQRGDLPPIVTSTTKITGKGQVYFTNKILSEEGAER